MGTPDPKNRGYDTDGEPLVKGVVSAVAAMTGQTSWNGPRVAAAMEKAMSAAILECNAAGLATGNPEHQPLIREAMLSARQRVLDEARAAAEKEAAEREERLRRG